MSEPVRVTCSVGFTKNLGNFESLRIDIGVSDSARPGETASVATDRVYQFVSDQLLEKVEDLNRELNRGNG